MLDRAIRRAAINVDASGIGGTGGTIPSERAAAPISTMRSIWPAHDELAHEAGRKAMVILTDAEDTGSKMSLGRGRRSRATRRRCDSRDPDYRPRRDGRIWAGSGAEWLARYGRTRDQRSQRQRTREGVRRNFRGAALAIRAWLLSDQIRSATARSARSRSKCTAPDMKILARKGYYAPDSLRAL